MKNKQKTRILFLAALLSVILYSCANIGSPNGGPYDEQPPKFIGSVPAPNAVNYKGKTVDIFFDELIQIESPSQNVIITPPQKELPIIKASGKKAHIELLDTLLENTTYTIDFGSYLTDNNEKNPLENFSFAFSTGDVLDSLEVSGFLLNAENMEPMPGITIGVHSDLADSAFVKKRFVRTSRTNDRGRFVIRNLAPGTYRIYALNDVNRDYRFDQPGEDIAFTDSLIVPSFEFASRRDTLWKDSVTIDTIKTIGYTRFMPDNIELRLFKEKFERQYISKPKWEDERFFTLAFNAPLDTLPVPRPLNFEPAMDKWYVAQPSDGNKSVNIWLIDSTVYKRDSLSFELTYPKSDSLNILRPQTDTFDLAIRRRPAPKKKKLKEGETEPIEFIGLNIDAPSSMDIFDTVTVDLDAPVLDLKKEHFYLDMMVDSVWQPVDFDFYQDSANILRYYISRKWKYGEEYHIEVDSASIYNVYGKFNNGFKTEFKIKTEDSYGHLFINIIGADTTAYVELLNSSDQPVRHSRVKNGGALFMDLKPDKYFVRLVVDSNGNDKWDTGNYAEKRQPEKVYYSPKIYTIMQNFEVEETWDINAAPADKQKPLDITKNKPKELTKKKRNYKDEGKAQKSSNSSGIPGMSGLGF